MTYWKVITFVIGIIHYWRQPRQAGTVPGVCISEKASDTTRRLAVADFISTVNSANVPWLTDGSDLTVFMAQLDLCLAEWAWVRGECTVGQESRREKRLAEIASTNHELQELVQRVTYSWHICATSLYRACFHISDENYESPLSYGVWVADVAKCWA